MPLPQRGGVQLDSQPSPSTRLPSSHSSPAVDDAVAAARRACSCCRSRRRRSGCRRRTARRPVTMPSPQRRSTCSWRRSRRRSTRLPSSHSSPPGDDAVAAARSCVQLVSQPSPFDRVAVVALLAVPVTMPLPQRGSVQLASQPSPLTVLPSSHCLAAGRRCRCRSAVARAVGVAAVAVDRCCRRRTASPAVTHAVAAARSACSWRRSRRRWRRCRRRTARPPDSGRRRRTWRRPTAWSPCAVTVPGGFAREDDALLAGCLELQADRHGEARASP